MSAAAGPPRPQGRVLRTPPRPEPKPGWDREGVRGGWGGACWWVGRRPPPSSQGLLTKLRFQINSVVAEASEGYGCHGDGAERGSSGMARSEPGGGGAAREPQASLRRVRAGWPDCLGALAPDPPFV